MRKYKYTVNFTLDEFTDWDLFKFAKRNYSMGEGVWDNVIEWETPVYYDTGYYLDEYREKALDYLKSKGATDSELEYIECDDTLDSDILRACSDSWRDSVESGILDLYKDKTENPGFEYSAYSFIDSNGNQTKSPWDAVSVNYYFSAKFWRENIYDSREYDSIREALDYADDDITEYCTDNLEKLSTGNYGDFHLIQDNADIDKNFIHFFSEYNETQNDIDIYRDDLATKKKNRESRIKELIKNHVPIIQRPAILASL